MQISETIIKEIEEKFEIFKNSNQEKFELNDFKGVFIFFGKKPEKLLFPFGEKEGVRIYLGSE